MILIELGAGDRPFEDGRGWLHNDTRKLPDIELVCPAEHLFSFFSKYVGQVSELRATHLLEHFPYPKTVEILRNWAKLLVPGGSLYLEVPNMEWQISACYNKEITPEEFVYFAYGEQNYQGNFHFAGFDEQLLRKRLFDAGYKVTGVTNIGQVLCAKAII